MIPGATHYGACGRCSNLTAADLASPRLQHLFCRPIGSRPWSRSFRCTAYACTHAGSRNFQRSSRARTSSPSMRISRRTRTPGRWPSTPWTSTSRARDRAKSSVRGRAQPSWLVSGLNDGVPGAAFPAHRDWVSSVINSHANVAAAAEDRGVPTIVDLFGARLAEELVAHGRER